MLSPMCIFSQAVRHVGATRIFARGVGDRQRLAYAMDFAAAEELAMILPIPVPVGSAEDAVRFVDLSGYEKLFDDLRAAFPVPQSRSLSFGAPAPAALAILEVHRVGAFDASFVPTAGDFARLDPRFQLPESLLSTVPAYRDWGFAVFALRPSVGDGATEHVHPMAFDFPRRDPSRLFFPTVHVHDGSVHARAVFDHELYAQGDASRLSTWERSPLQTSSSVDVSRAQGLVDGDAPLHRRSLQGMLENADTWA